MIFLFSDFGQEGPYLGQVKAVLANLAPGVPVIDLCADVPAFRSQGAAYLLAALTPGLPGKNVFLCVVDPGVGSERPPVAARIDGHWYVGPGNGLFEPLVRRAATVEEYVLIPPETVVSATFHGRDLFAPVAARLALDDRRDLRPHPLPRFPTWPDDLAEVVYLDRFGNLMTGLRENALPGGCALAFKGRRLRRARTFSDVPVGEPFWYGNANNLVEIAVNQGAASSFFHAEVGDGVEIL